MKFKISLRTITGLKYKHGKINKVDGAFLREQPEGKEWFKVSDHSEATIYYNSKKGLYIEDTTARFNPIRLYRKKYYVDWVDKNDNKRGRPTENPFEK